MNKKTKIYRLFNNEYKTNNYSLALQIYIGYLTEKLIISF